LIWVAPANIEYMKSQGMAVENLDRSVEVVREVARDGGASFVDLHWMLPDAAFADAGDHVTFEEPVDGTALLGERLGREIESMLAPKRSGSREREEEAARAVQ
jgi:hypothetical protein